MIGHLTKIKCRLFKDGGLKILIFVLTVSYHMNKIGRVSSELNFGVDFTNEDIKSEIKFKLNGLFNALISDIIEQGLEFPIVINLEHERENLNQRFKAIAKEDNRNDNTSPS